MDAMIGSFHGIWGWVSVGVDVIAGFFGVILGIRRLPPSRAFRAVGAAAIVAALLQVGAGLLLYGEGLRPGGFHVFYGIVTLITLAFAYVYRSELAKKNTSLRWGLLFLFMGGLGLRAIMTFGT